MNTLKYIIISLLLASIIIYEACEETPIIIDNPISIELSDSVLPADGTSKITVIVDIDSRFNNNFRKVSLKASGGKIQGGSDNGTVLDINANNNGVATVDFIVGDVPGTYSISATLGTDKKYFAEQRFELQPLISSELIAISADTTGITANGTDKFPITISAPDFPGKKFELSSSNGLLEGEVNKKYTGQLDNSGKAIVNITTEVFIHSYTITAKIISPDLVTYKTIIISELKAIASDLITLLADTTGIVANGLDKIPISISAPNFPGKSITISSSDGKIDGEKNGEYTVQLDANGNAQANLETDIFINNYTITVKLNSPLLTTYKTIGITKLNANDIISLSLSDTVGDLSDNFSTFSATVNVSHINTNGVNITFEVVNGTILNSTDPSSVLSPLHNGEGDIKLQTTDELKEITIIASLANPNISVRESFLPGIAYPEEIQAVPDNWANDSSNFSVGITLYVNRTYGNVTQDRLISTNAYQIINDSTIYLGKFDAIPIKTDANEKASLNFSASSPDPSVPVVLEFSTLNGSGMSIGDTIAIAVNPK